MRAAKRLLLRGEDILGNLCLVIRGRVAVDDIALHRAIESGAVSDGGSASRFGIGASGSLLHGLGQSLQASLGGLVARSIAEGFAGGFDCGLGIGHGRM